MGGKRYRIQPTEDSKYQPNQLPLNRRRDNFKSSKSFLLDISYVSINLKPANNSPAAVGRPKTSTRANVSRRTDGSLTKAVTSYIPAASPPRCIPTSRKGTTNESSKLDAISEPTNAIPSNPAIRTLRFITVSASGMSNEINQNGKTWRLVFTAIAHITMTSGMKPNGLRKAASKHA